MPDLDDRTTESSIGEREDSGGLDKEPVSPYLQEKTCLGVWKFPRYKVT